MNTLQLCEYIQTKCVGFKSIPQILALLNIAQNEILSEDCELMRVKPDPFLETTSGTYLYNLDVGIRSVTNVYLLEPALPTNPEWRNFEYTASLNEDQFGRKMMYVPTIRVEAPDPDSQATIQFDAEFDPKTTTDQYRLIAYSWPEQLTSTSIPVTIPLQHRMKVLTARVMMMIEEESFGRADTWERKYMNYLAEFLSYTRALNNIDEDTRIRPSGLA